MAVEIYADVLEAVRGDRLVEQAMSRDGERLVIQDRSFDLGLYRRIVVAGAGKAAPAMATAAARILGDRVADGLIVTKYGHRGDLAGLPCIEAGHPIPDENSLAAGRAMLELARGCDEGDLAVFLLTGGASALMEAPADNLTLDDLRLMNETLLGAGVGIERINAIRARVSKIKGGGLARAFDPATVVVLALSDVVGNSLRAIGSGPFVPPEPDPPLPYELLDLLPAAVRTEILSAGLLTSPTPAVPHFVVGSVSLAIHAAADAARARGLEPLPYQDPMAGEAAAMARRIVHLGRRRAMKSGSFCLIFGGETTVALGDGERGRGGRCQEMAVAAAALVERMPGCAFLAAGTDGTDGPTDAVGGLVEGDSLSLAHAAGASERTALADHDSYPFLDALGGLIRTGPTGSNVNDISLFVQA